MRERACICVFARPAIPGQTKTRLAAAVGDEAAATLARAFFADAWLTARKQPDADCVLATTSSPDGTLALEPDTAVWLQGEGDLGARMERILRRALAAQPLAFAVGADIPGLPQRLWDAARTLLDDTDAVIGPCDDGGFHLLGLRRCPPGLLADIPWSARETCERTIARLKSAGMRVRQLPVWFDIDEFPDLQRFHGLLQRGEVVAPHTESALLKLAARGVVLGQA